MNLRGTRTKVVTGALAGLAVLGGIAAVAGQGEDAAADPAVKTVADVSGDSVTETSVLSADAAERILAAAQDAAADRDVRVTVAIVDRTGNTVALLRGDGAGPQTDQSAIDKAFTAVSFGKATSELAGNTGGDGPTIADIPGTLFLAGGVPVTVDGFPVAGIGVGGAPDGAIDEEIATAALAAIQ